MDKIARTRIREISALDGLPLKDAERMPHPVDLSRWQEIGLYVIDVDVGVFRLTELGMRNGRR